MSKKSDITEISICPAPNSGLIYTNKSGWIDLGHANPAGASKLWKDIKNGALTAGGKSTFLVQYRQTMRRFGLTAGAGQTYIVNARLSEKNLQRVALAIFMDVSIKFETLQSNWLYSKITDSGFSSEDLTSDLVGFYRAINPTIDYIQLCEPTSKQYAIKIWDSFGPVGATKLFGFGVYLYAVDAQTGVPSSMCSELPSFLRTISPAPESQTYFEKYQP